MSDIKAAFTALKANDPNPRITFDMSNLTNLTSLTDSAFADCINLAAIILPDGVQSIRSNAFANCTKLTYIKVPKTLTELTMVALNSCTGLSTIEYEGTMAEWNSIEKTDTEGMEWNYGCNAITVICSDGSITVPAP